MRFSIYCNPQTRGPEGDIEQIDLTIEQALRATEAGFDGIALTEHHVSGYNTFGDNMMMAAHLAPQVRRRALPAGDRGAADASPDAARPAVQPARHPVPRRRHHRHGRRRLAGRIPRARPQSEEPPRRDDGGDRGGREGARPQAVRSALPVVDRLREGPAVDPRHADLLSAAAALRARGAERRGRGLDRPARLVPDDGARADRGDRASLPALSRRARQDRARRRHRSPSSTTGARSPARS